MLTKAFLLSFPSTIKYALKESDRGWTKDEELDRCYQNEPAYWAYWWGVSRAEGSPSTWGKEFPKYPLLAIINWVCLL